MMNKEKSKENGFTLVEMLVALTILSIGLAGLFSIFSTGLHRVDDTRAMRDATALAQSLIAQVGTEIPLTEDKKIGTTPDGLRWKVTMKPYGDAGATQFLPVNAYEISIDVTWGTGSTHDLTVSTLRLAVRS